MAQWALLPALAGVAMTLAGCGSSKENNSPPDFVSQTLTGSMEAQGQVNTTEMSLNGQVSIALDADAMNLRMDITVAKPTNATHSIIVNGTQMLVTSFSKSGAAAGACRTQDLSNLLPSAQQLKAMIKANLLLQKPDGMDGSLRKFSSTTPAGFPLSEQSTVELDDSNVLHKSSVSLNGTLQGTTVTESVSFSADSAKGGQPELSVFEVPKEWGPCKPSDIGAEATALLALLATGAPRERGPPQLPEAAVVV